MVGVAIESPVSIFVGHLLTVINRHYVEPVQKPRRNGVGKQDSRNPALRNPSQPSQIFTIAAIETSQCVGMRLQRRVQLHRLTMLSLFCERKEKEHDNMIEYLDKDCPTFDTLETEGTEFSVDKNGDVANCESLLEQVTLLDDAKEAFQFGQQKKMTQEMIAWEEGGDVREAAHCFSHKAEFDEANSPGSAQDLQVTDNQEGPDMPIHEDDKMKLEGANLLAGAATKTRVVPGAGNTTSNVIFVCHANRGLDDASSLSKDDCKSELRDAEVLSKEQEPYSVMLDGAIFFASDAETVSSEEERPTQEEGKSHSASPNETVVDDSKLGVKETGAASAGEVNLDGDTFSDAVELQQNLKLLESSNKTSSADTATEVAEERGFADKAGGCAEPSSETVYRQSEDTEEPRHVESSTPPSSGEVPVDHLQEPGTPEKAADVVEDTVPLAEKGDSKPGSQPDPTDSTAASVERETLSPQLLIPTLDHSEDVQVQDDAVLASLTEGVNGNDACRIDNLESDATEETASDSFDESERSVRFADPLVTSSWDVPRIHSDDLEELFYTAMDISK